MPEWMDPMLATLTEDYFFSKDWIYERKLVEGSCQELGIIVGVKAKICLSMYL